MGKPNTPDRCPLCRAEPTVDGNGFVSCPTVFEPLGKSCPMYGESVDIWNEFCRLFTRAPVAVKGQLVFTEFKEGGCTGKPKAYQYFITTNEDETVFFCHWSGMQYGDLETAKAAANADYESAISDDPEPKPMVGLFSTLNDEQKASALDMPDNPIGTTDTPTADIDLTGTTDAEKMIHAQAFSAGYEAGVAIGVAQARLTVSQHVDWNPSTIRADLLLNIDMTCDGTAPVTATVSVAEAAADLMQANMETLIRAAANGKHSQACDGGFGLVGYLYGEAAFYAIRNALRKLAEETGQ